MNSLRMLLLSLGVVSLAACGGSSKAVDTAPADESLEATPVASEATPADEAAPADEVVAAAPEGTDGAAAGGDLVGPCATFCTEVLTCAKQASGKEPSEEEETQFNQTCVSKCAQEDPKQLEQAGVCVSENQGNCAGLFQCLNKIESGS
jgi:Cys-rich protein (TIGR04453 family)